MAERRRCRDISLKDNILNTVDDSNSATTTTTTTTKGKGQRDMDSTIPLLKKARTMGITDSPPTSTPANSKAAFEEGGRERECMGDLDSHEITLNELDEICKRYQVSLKSW